MYLRHGKNIDFNMPTALPIDNVVGIFYNSWYIFLMEVWGVKEKNKLTLFVATKIFLLAVIICVSGIHGSAEAVNKDKCVTGLNLALNLARYEPVENILFAYMGDDLYEFFKLDGTAQNRKAVIYHVPYHTPTATYTLYELSAKELIKELEYFDEMKIDNCRYPYVVSKPLIIFSLRFYEKDNKNMKYMLHFRMLPTDNDEWKEYLSAFMTAATVSGGTLMFDWHPVYQIAFSKETKSSPIYHAMERQDKIGEQVFENVEKINESSIMKKESLSLSYFETLMKDWYKDHPELTTLNFQEELQKTLKSEEYTKTLNEINALVARNLN